MSRPRLFLPAAEWAGRVPLRGQARHKLVQVLRLEAGGEVEVFDGEGRACRAELERDGQGWFLRLGPARQQGERRRRVRLGLALSKGRKPELVVRMATEVGVSTLEPFLARRSVARPPAERWRQRRRRWQAIVREAARQSGRSRLPEVGELRDFAGMLEQAGRSLALILQPGAEHTLPELLAREPGRECLLLLGPEGGFQDDEIEQARGAGFLEAGLPLPVLRAETAAVVAAALACMG